MTSSPLVPLSWGEILDKITILQIKDACITDAAKRANVAAELAALGAIAAPVLAEAAPLVAQLKAINESLWEIEDKIRDKEAAQNFDGEFIALARAVYHTNDERAAVKRAINLALKSALVEEKSYKPYAAPKPPKA
jgi:hypothetical protein